MTEPISVTIDADTVVAIITLDRPGRPNRLTVVDSGGSSRLPRAVGAPRAMRLAALAGKRQPRFTGQ